MAQTSQESGRTALRQIVPHGRHLWSHEDLEEPLSMPRGLQDPLWSTSTSFLRLRQPERILTLDAGTLKCLATAATTALLAAPSTGDAVTQTSITPPIHEDLACEALG
jgi:hypothetical protein